MRGTPPPVYPTGPTRTPRQARPARPPHARPPRQHGPDTSTTDLKLGRPRALTVRQDQDVLDDTTAGRLVILTQTTPRRAVTSSTVNEIQARVTGGPGPGSWPVRNTPRTRGKVTTK